MSPDSIARQVSLRDQGRCVVCGGAAARIVELFDARLWDDGGPGADNAVSLCTDHAREALFTHLSVEDLMDHAGLVERPLPPQLHAVERYDRWGNPLLSDGRRARGELFFDPEVQDWLRHGGMLERFVPWVKYPRTHVLPWSQTIGEGDRLMQSLDRLAAGEVIVSEKMDGENVSLYRDFLHTRSLARIPHASRVWLDRFWEGIRGDIPQDWRVCGEYLYVSHTVSYTRLPSYFMAFSVWDDRNNCLSWDETLAFLAAAGIEPVTVLYRGPLDQDAIHAAWSARQAPNSEGYIVRTAERFRYRDFRRCAGKFIRSCYVQSEPVKDNMKTGARISTNSLDSRLQAPS